MSHGIFTVPPPRNEPVLSYAPGSPERAELQRELAEMSHRQLEVPIVIGDQTLRTGLLRDMRMPHDRHHLLGQYHAASREHVAMAVEAARKAAPEWARMPWEERAAIFLRAAEILAGPYRKVLNAATMLGQSKTAYQAEIDAACELIDFLRFNVAYMSQLYAMQPLSSPGTWNRLDYRPLEGFVLAVTPFNFTAIAGNLPMSAALMGNVVIWKPASSAVFAAWHVLKLYEMAGLPPGVITMLPGDGGEVADPLVDHPDLAGVHFTGSTPVFQGIWRRVGNQIDRYRTYPRLVGETGGKDFVVAHSSADGAELATALVRGAFEFQGQKCSAASRAYVPDTLWPQVERIMKEQVASIKMGDVRDFTNFMGAVIDQAAFKRISGYLEHARGSSSGRIVSGGKADDSRGWFVEPTVYQTDDAQDRLMQEEVFGPLLTVHVYPAAAFEQVLDTCDRTSPYGLTGSIFARDRQVILQAAERLRHAAGNFYINDKPTGAVVGQQPFGGGRASGTNDKAGSMFNLMKWVSPRAIKETFVPPTDYRYPFLEPERHTSSVEAAGAPVR
jgi:1-pyrroline-5-carboxylate dehydrogenase